MKCNLIILILLTLPTFSCGDLNPTKKSNHKEVEKFWELVKEAMEGRDIDFLITNSTEKIQCSVCNSNDSISEWYEVEGFYSSYLEKIKPPIEKDYGVSYDPNQDNYKVSYEMNGDKNYNDVYVIVKDEGELKFQGMFSIP